MSDENGKTGPDKVIEARLEPQSDITGFELASLLQYFLGVPLTETAWRNMPSNFRRHLVRVDESGKDYRDPDSPPPLEWQEGIDGDRNTFWIARWPLNPESDSIKIFKKLKDDRIVFSAAFAVSLQYKLPSIHPEASHSMYPDEMKFLLQRWYEKCWRESFVGGAS